MSAQTALDYRTNRDLFSNYHLNEHLPETEAWSEIDEGELQAAYEEIKELWDEQKDTVERRNESQLEEKFIRPMFRKLGIPFEVEESANETQRRPDYGFFETEADATDAFQRREEGGDFYQNAVAVADAKRWGRKLDTRGKKKRDYENPSHQIDQYLRFTSTTWGVLTNGQKWRLYYKPTSHKLDSYYEIDLPTVLETGSLEEFKYFYLFFRHQAFVPDASGDAFLDNVYEESNLFAQDLGQDLQDNIYDAIVELSEGFLQYPENDLDENKLDLIHDSSLIYLYRIIFVLYAEAEGRDLLDTNNEIYESQYSLNQLKQEVAKELESGDPKYRDWQDNLHSQLDELFTLIDQGSKSRGIPEEDLYIPAYNGGLFRTDPDESGSKEARFLANNTVGDEHLARVIELLTRSESSNGGGKIFVDYSSLDVRHLGSIYEGLLEYQLNVADEPLALNDGEYVVTDEDSEIVVERDDVYLMTGGGERKATGSYYTPEYVVEYIVDETLRGPVDEIRQDVVMDEEYQDGGYAAEFANRVFDLKILDPAMGSGHFLTSAVDYLARAIITEQNREADEKGGNIIDDKHDINWARRKVAQRCIYGVDINPLATELAKVSLWLRTLAAEQPLAFLDHHLKTGNSLVGSDIQDVLVDDDESKTDEGQLTLEQSFAHTRKQALDHVMDRFSELLAIDNETLEDAKEMEDVYQSVQRDPLYQKLLAMTNVHTAEQFGLDVPVDADKRMAEALRSDSWEEIEELDWFNSAQTIADEEKFFHWELEFPVAFYDIDGNRMKDAGFDAVIGNPPWVNAWEMTDEDEEIRRVIENLMTIDGVLKSHWDLYVAFLLKAYSVTKKGKKFSFIIPNAVSREKYANPLRKFLLEETRIDSITSFGEENVFKGVSRQTVVPVFTKDRPELDNHNVHVVDPTEVVPPSIAKNIEGESSKIPQKMFYHNVGYQIRHELSGEEFEILEKIDDSLKLGNLCYVNYGAQVSSKKSGEFGKDDVVSETQDQKYWKKFFEGNDLSRYRIDWDNLFLDYRPNEMYGPRSPALFESKKLVVRKVSGLDDSIIAAYDDEGLYCDDGLVLATPYENIEETGLNEDFEGYEKIENKYELGFLLAVINSSVESFYYKMRLATGSLQGGYSHVYPQHVRQFPIPSISFNTQESERTPQVSELLESYEIYLQDGGSEPLPNENHVDGVAHDYLTELSDQMINLHTERASANLNLLDYFGSYEEGPNLPDIGLFQPTESNILDATTAEYEKLQIEQIQIERNGSRVKIYATARYKPEDLDEFETDTYGYTETEYKEAFTLTNLSDKEAVLVESFVPVAVEKAGGFANFRDNATKTKSLVDRLKAMTLPDIDDVADDLERFIKVKERAEELDEKIKKTDQLIDKIVYDLYDLTDEEIDIVESAVSDD